MLIKPPSTKSNNRGRLLIPRKTMTIALAVLTTRRLAVRALSSTSGLSLGRPAHVTTIRSQSPAVRNTFTMHATPSSRHARFSTAANTDQDTDRELEHALDELLGEALGEAENPFLEGELAKGHVLGSREFPRGLLEVEKEHDYTDQKFLSTSNPHWTSLGLPPSIIDVLSHKGITHLTPVQAKAMAPILAGRDVIGRSRTGTGKTLAFGMPTVVRLVEMAKKKKNCEVLADGSIRMKKGRLPGMIVMCPTRELAKQVDGELAEICKPLGLFTQVFHGGVSYDPQARALRQGVDIVVGTPGRVIDHLERGNLRLDECSVVVLDEADEMLNMGFAEDVEVILEGVGSENDEKTQVLLFSATTPPWVKEIGSQYQKDVLSIDITGDKASRTATTVRHVAVQVPFGESAKKDLLEDIIAVEISKDLNLDILGAEKDADGDEEEDEHHNPIAAAVKAAKSRSSSAFQQKLFGKTIVFTETKAQCDELVSGGVFKTLTAQAIHGDIGQKQRDATLAAFRAGAFNVLVATDVAARGIDIKDVDLVIQFQPPRDNDVYVHRSGRTGRAGAKGISVLLFQKNEARDIVRIERSLGHGFKFDLQGPPSAEAALNAAAKTSAIACQSVADETAEHFKEAAASLLAKSDSPEDVVARCLAAISRRTVQVESRSLLTGELGFATVEMTNSKGRNVSPGDVMFTVGKLARMSQQEGGDLQFDSEIGKIQTNYETGSAMFDMGVEDAKKLLEFSKDIEAGGAVFSILKEMEINRGRDFGQTLGGRGGRGGRGGGRGGYGRGDGYGGRGYSGGGSYDRQGGYDNSRGNDRFDRGGGRFNRYDGGVGGRRSNYDDGGYGGSRRSFSSGPRPTRQSAAPKRQPRSNEW